MANTLRAGNTGREMVESGQGVKAGRKHYRHESGIEIAYNCNRWVWEIVGHGEAYTLLWAARHWAEKQAAC